MTSYPARYEIRFTDDAALFLLMGGHGRYTRQITSVAFSELAKLAKTAGQRDRERLHSLREIWKRRGTATTPVRDWRTFWRKVESRHWTRDEMDAWLESRGLQ